MKTVVITGGSRGIGAAAVELFAARGDRVFFLYEKNHEAARAVAQAPARRPFAATWRTERRCGPPLTGSGMWMS